MQRVFIAVVCAAILVVGCGSEHKPTAQNSPRPSGTHVIRIGKMSLRVPRGWTVGKEIHLNESAAAPGVLFPKTSATSDIALNPKNKSPFFSEALYVHGDTAGISLWELSASGESYALSIVVPLREQTALRKVATRISTPPVATATDVVRFTEQAAKAQNRPLSTTSVGSNRWLLASGLPGTAQEPFALYHSTDGGKSWSLERSTHFTGSNGFMGLEGSATVFFWTTRDGLIAESSGFVSKLLVYRTTNGGETWSSEAIGVHGQPDDVVTPTIEQNSDGSLVISGSLVSSSSTFTVKSLDGGKNWSLVQ